MYLYLYIYQLECPLAQLESLSSCPIDSDINLEDSEINLKLYLRNKNPSLVKSLYFL